MAIAGISIQYQGNSPYLIAVAAKTTTPLVEADRVFIGSPVPVNVNIVFENLLPVPHNIDIYNSPDGINLGSKATNQFTYDVKDSHPATERLFYTVDGIEPEDPISDQDTLNDPYLNGRSITGVYKQGDRYLKPDIDYELVAGGGIRLLNGVLFSTGEELTIEIAYTVTRPSTYLPPGAAGGFATVTTDTLLIDDFDNYIINTKSAGQRITLTLRPISSIQDMITFHVLNPEGAQLFAKIVTSNGDKIIFNGQPRTDIAIGKNEYVKIVKTTDVLANTSAFYISECSMGLNTVGERVEIDDLATPNVLPWDDSVKLGDDYPRLWYWLNNNLASANKIITTDANITNARIAGREGQFMIGDTKFRMPDGRGWSKRGIGGTDVVPVFNSPGGTLPDQVGSHWHPSGTQVNSDANGGQANPLYNRAPNHNVRRWNVQSGIDANQTASTDLNAAENTPNITKSILTIFATRT